VLVVVVTSLVTLGRLAVAVVAFAAARSGQVREILPASPASPWVRSLLAAPQEPTQQALFDFGVSLACLALAVAILVTARETWSMRLLALAMVATAGTCNLTVEAVARSVRHSAGLPDAPVDGAFLQLVALAAFLLALSTYPSVRPGQHGPASVQLLTVSIPAVVVGTAAVTLLPPAVSYVVVFGLVLPLAGLLLSGRRARAELTADERVRLRLLFSVFVGATTISLAIVVVTVAISLTTWQGLTLSDPTAAVSEPDLARQSALLFWFCRLLTLGIGMGALAAARRKDLYLVERRFSRGLVVAIVATLVGGLFVVIYVALDAAAGLEGTLPIVLGALPASLVLFPTYLRVESGVDQLLYGGRPAPYSVLAGIGSISRAGNVTSPDLSRVAEAVGRGLDAKVCSLTVHRPGLSDRTYAWYADEQNDAGPLLTVPIVRGDERLGALTVDRASVAGLHEHRQHLLDDVAESLGSVLEASRLGIELERQLRAVRAHAADIAASRRRLVSEMDAEGRRIERDLHDGAQHHLVSLRLSLGLTEHQVATERFDQAKVSLDRITEQIAVTEAILARTATGVSSPLLAEHGLVGALEQELAGGRPPVLLRTSGLDPSSRFPQAVESALWFCCLEAVNNARKHAPGAAIELRLHEGPGRLEFGVHDDGPGWDMVASAGSTGRGTHNLMARVLAVGGQVSVRSEPGAGTRIDGWVPVPDEPIGGMPDPTVVGMNPDPSAASAGTPKEGADDTLFSRTRALLGEALVRYDDTPAAGKVREVLDALLAAGGGTAANGAAPTARNRRTQTLAAWSSLRELDAVVRNEPPPTEGPALLHRLEWTRSTAHELAEVDAIDALRSGDHPLGSDDVERAARLLGEFGEEAHARLGLAPDTDPALVSAAAEQALGAWRARASHPASTQGMRLLAGTIVQSCERLLHPA